MVILDTNVLSALMRPTMNREVVTWLDGQARSSVWTTAITVMEISFGLSTMAVGRQRDRRSGEYQRLMDEDLHNRVLVFDAEAAEQTGRLMAARRLTGRSGDLRDS